MNASLSDSIIMIFLGLSCVINSINLYNLSERIHNLEKNIQYKENIYMIKIK